MQMIQDLTKKSINQQILACRCCSKADFSFAVVKTSYDLCFFSSSQVEEFENVGVLQQLELQQPSCCFNLYSLCMCVFIT